jgi:hypothetical protein
MDSRRAGGGNRMMTSTTLQTNDIWSKTIGHDPHAGDAEAAEDAAARERQEERARGVMELARLDAIKQGGSSRGDNFAQSLFWGLKRKAPPRGYEMAPVESSSSSGSSSDEDDDSAAAARAAKRRRADLAALAALASESSKAASRPGVAPLLLPPTRTNIT